MALEIDRASQGEEPAARLKDRIWQALKATPYPGLTRDIVSFGLVQRVAECGGVVAISLGVAHLPEEKRELLARTVHHAVSELEGVKSLRVEVVSPAGMAAPRTSTAARAGTAREGAHPRALQQPDGEAGHPLSVPMRVPGVRRLVAVGSGKGGVGKSTVAVNLALAFGRLGRTGILDADVYGPNVPRMMGVHQFPDPDGDRIRPAMAWGVEVVSVGFLLSRERPLIWRGPLTDKLIRQFLHGVQWGDLDMLVVDLPPGTGDIPLSLVKWSKPDGAIVVVTPQEVAADDAYKAANMFRQLEIPILGVVENMSYFVCDRCGTRHPLFGEGGGRQMAEALGVPLLGEVPFVPGVARGGDTGKPAAEVAPVMASMFDRIARRVWAAMEHLESGR